MKGIWIIIKAIGKFIQGLGTFFLGVLAILIVILIAVAMQPKPGVTVPDGAVLVFNPSGSIVEMTQPISPADIAFKEFNSAPVETSFHDIIHALEIAKDDDRISAIALATDSLGGGGISHMHDIANALKSFKESGKPIYAISSSYGQGSYLLASVADEIFVNPRGSAVLEGYTADVMYYKDMLEKIGVTVNIFHVGDFKSAIEPYERSNMSPEAREAYTTLLGGLWADYLKTVSEGRELDVAELQAKIDNLPEEFKKVNGDFAELAKAMGLVDTVSPRVDYRQAIAEKHGPDGDSFKQISLKQYMKAIEPSQYAGNKGEIAVIVAQGEIVNGYGGSDVIAAETVAAKIRNIRTKKKTKAIVLRVNSPGGSADGSDIIRQELITAQEDGIKVVVSMGPVAASGGYWISADADEIWASPQTITGSIGIFGMIPTFEKAAKTVGISTDQAGTTKLAGAMALDRPISDTLSSIISQSINAGYAEFIDLVANGRGMEKEAVEKIAQGRVWTGKQALENGLVDKLGTLEDAVKSAAALAELGDDYSVYMPKNKVDPFDQFLLDVLKNGQVTDQAPMQQGVLGQLMTQAKKEFEMLNRFNDPKGRYVICLACKVR